MPRKFRLLFLSAIALTGVAAQPMHAAADADWPFQLLPKPGRVVDSSPPDESPDIGDELPYVNVPVSVLANEYVAPKDLTIKLDQTEGKSFKLEGEVWLDGPSPRLRYPLDEPAGFGLFLRQVDGLHRYEANSVRLRAKRRLLGGVLQTKIVQIATWPSPPLHAWVSFSLTVTKERIAVYFDGHAGEIRGPLNTDGVNEIALVAGTKLKNVRLALLDDAHN